MEVTVRNYTIEPESELRFEVEHDQTATLKLQEGTAEIFGTELALQKDYTFAGQNVAVFSWTGCKIQLTGRAQAYVANETTMVSYMNVHTALEKIRQHAAATMSNGPRVVIAGPVDSGKSSLSKILLGYAARCHRKVTFIDLDVGQGQITPPGTIAAVAMEKPVDIMDGFSMTAPLSFYYGHANMAENVHAFRALVERLAECVDMRCEAVPEAKSSGTIINTAGWVEKLGYDLLLHTIRTFSADIILVLGDDKLHSNLLDSFRSQPSMSIQKIPKSGGVVSRDRTFRAKGRSSKVKEYFYGPYETLCPHSVVVHFSDISIFRVGGAPKAPSSALPIGAEPTQDPLQLTRVVPSADLTHSVLGVSHADSIDEILSSNLAGLVYVSHVDVEKQQVTLLAPSPGGLPKKFCLAGTLKWFD